MQFIREERLQQLHSLTKLYRADFTFCSTPHKTFWRNSLHGPRENSTSLYGPDKMKLPCIAFVLFSIPCIASLSPTVGKFRQHRTEPDGRPLQVPAPAMQARWLPCSSPCSAPRPPCLPLPIPVPIARASRRPRPSVPPRRAHTRPPRLPPQQRHLCDGHAAPELPSPSPEQLGGEASEPDRARARAPFVLASTRAAGWSSSCTARRKLQERPHCRRHCRRDASGWSWPRWCRRPPPPP